MAKIIGYCTIDFFSKNGISLNIFSTREDSTVKKIKKKSVQEGAFQKKNDCRGALN